MCTHVHNDDYMYIYTDYSCCSVTNTAHTTLSLGEMFFEVEEYGLVAGMWAEHGHTRAQPKPTWAKLGPIAPLAGNEVAKQVRRET